MGSVTDLFRRSVSRGTTETRIRTVLILGGLLVCSLAINLLLARRVSSLKRTVSLIKSESRLALGDTVPSVVAKDPQGQTAVLDYSQTQLPTVVFIFTPTCGWCTKNIMNVRALVENTGSRFRFVGMSLSSDKLVEYINENKLQFPIYTDLPILTMRAYKLGGTPETIVVSPQGQVVRIWSGAFAEDLQREVEDYFGVKLPGIKDPERAAK
jgi:peroxiredoxin